MPKHLRRIVYQDLKTGKVYVFLTITSAGGQDIADIYKERCRSRSSSADQAEFEDQGLHRQF